MTSALDLINDGALFANVGDLYNALSAEESSLGLRLLNNLLDAESTQEYTIVDWNEGTTALGVGVPSYLTSLLAGAPNPSLIQRCTVVDSSGFTYPMREFGMEDWANIDWKASPGRPSAWYYATAAPFGTINVWQTPSFAGDVLHVWYGAQLQQFANLATTLVAPMGFEMYLKTNLGSLLAMWFHKELTPKQEREAAKWRDYVRATRIKTLELDIPAESRYRYNIYTDNY